MGIRHRPLRQLHVGDPRLGHVLGHDEVLGERGVHFGRNPLHGQARPQEEEEAHQLLPGRREAGQTL